MKTYGVPITLPSGSSTVTTSAIPTDGEFKGAHVASSGITGLSFTLTIKDKNGFTVFERASL